MRLFSRTSITTAQVRVQNKKTGKLPGNIPVFQGVTSITYTPLTNMSNTCGNSLSLCFVSENFPLKSAQS